jgi:tyrosine-protein phosphatase SIW14
VIAFCALPRSFGQNVPSVPYFQQVNPDTFRGGQPSPFGFRVLSKLGIKTVLDLRSSAEQSAWEEKLVKSLGMRYVHLEFQGGVTPTQEQIEKALSVLEDRTQAPVFVHCHEGKDRTGMIIACYRISHDNWSNQKALAEAKSWAARELTSAMERSIIQYRPRSQPTHQ